MVISRYFICRWWCASFKIKITSDNLQKLKAFVFSEMQHTLSSLENYRSKNTTQPTRDNTTQHKTTQVQHKTTRVQHETT